MTSENNQYRHIRSIISADGEMIATSGLHSGNHRFSTQAQEIIAITEGHCRIKLAGDQAWTDYQAGDSITIPANTHFEIEVDDHLEFTCHPGGI
jgi:uncharacterized protein YaiE (UPF0345 family)